MALMQSTTTYIEQIQHKFMYCQLSLYQWTFKFNSEWPKIPKLSLLFLALSVWVLSSKLFVFHPCGLWNTCTAWYVPAVARLGCQQGTDRNSHCQRLGRLILLLGSCSKLILLVGLWKAGYTHLTTHHPEHSFRASGFITSFRYRDKSDSKNYIFPCLHSHLLVNKYLNPEQLPNS